MPRREVTEEEKREIQKKVKREFPRCKALQDIHYYRYVKEMEWQTMIPSEIVKEIKDGANKIRKEIEALRVDRYPKPIHHKKQRHMEVDGVE